MTELPTVVQALMLASFLFGLLLGCALAAGTIAFYMLQPRDPEPKLPEHTGSSPGPLSKT